MLASRGAHRPLAVRRDAATIVDAGLPGRNRVALRAADALRLFLVLGYVAPLARRFVARGGRRFHRPLVYDAIRACSADGVLSDGELATIQRMAVEMGVTDEELAELERLYAEERVVRAARIKACFPEGTPF